MVLDLIRGLDVRRADEVLQFTERGIATDVRKVLASAVANATNPNNAGSYIADADELFVLACFADEGPTLRRFSPRAAWPGDPHPQAHLPHHGRRRPHERAAAGDRPGPRRGRQRHRRRQPSRPRRAQPPARPGRQEGRRVDAGERRRARTTDDRSPKTQAAEDRDRRGRAIVDDVDVEQIARHPSTCEACRGPSRAVEDESSRRRVPRGIRRLRGRRVGRVGRRRRGRQRARHAPDQGQRRTRCSTTPPTAVTTRSPRPRSGSTPRSTPRRPASASPARSTADEESN